MLIQGRILHDPFTLPEPGWVAIEGDRIIEVGTGHPPDAPAAGGECHLISPGFVDAHLHLPQFSIIGYDGFELLDWLDRVVFPAEAAWSDSEFASSMAMNAFRELLAAGTLGFAGFLTSHEHGVDATCAVHEHVPLRAIVGRSLMDRNGPASALIESTDLGPSRIRDRFSTSIAPRFGPGCSADLLERAGAMVRDGAIVQTHLAETEHECALVGELFPDAPNYTTVYDRFGLLAEHTLLAHCVHLAPSEWELIAARRSVVVHCPAANTFLQSGLFNLDDARAHGVRLALGSDIAAGSDLAMPRIAQAMIETAKHRRMTVAPQAQVPSPEESWRLITRGNADALGFTDAGRIEPGAAADLLLLQPDFEIDSHLIGRLIYNWTNRYITHRVVAGQLLTPTLI